MGLSLGLLLTAATRSVLYVRILPNLGSWIGELTDTVR